MESPNRLGAGRCCRSCKTVSTTNLCRASYQLGPASSRASPIKDCAAFDALRKMLFLFGWKLLVFVGCHRRTFLLTVFDWRRQTLSTGEAPKPANVLCAKPAQPQRCGTKTSPPSTNSEFAKRQVNICSSDKSETRNAEHSLRDLSSSPPKRVRNSSREVSHDFTR